MIMKMNISEKKHSSYFLNSNHSICAVCTQQILDKITNDLLNFRKRTILDLITS